MCPPVSPLSYSLVHLSKNAATNWIIAKKLDKRKNPAADKLNKEEGKGKPNEKEGRWSIERYEMRDTLEEKLRVLRGPAGV